MNDVIDLDAFRRSQQIDKNRISVNLRNVSRQCRKEILSSNSYHSYLNGDISRGQYIDLLHTHLGLREHLESLFKMQGQTFNVINLISNEQKAYDLNQYVTHQRSRSHMLQQDIIELNGHIKEDLQLPEKALELINYMNRVEKLYSVALLGILYMLEETVTYAGPKIARAINSQRSLDGKGLQYLTQVDKRDLWSFRKTLDYITDFQSQANIVIASAFTYRMYRDLLDPRALRLNRKRILH